MTRIRARDGWEWSVRVTGYHSRWFRRWRGLRGMRTREGEPIVSNPLDAMREGTWFRRRPHPAEIAPAVAGGALDDGGLDGTDLVGGCAAAVILFIAVAVFVGFVVPAVSIAVELALLAVLGVAGYTLSLVGKRPWLVTATSLERIHTYRADSWRRARAMKAEVIASLRSQGRPPDGGES